MSLIKANVPVALGKVYVYVPLPNVLAKFTFW